MVDDNASIQQSKEGPGHSPTKPVVSILMPMRNAERHVGEALESVLAESNVPLEVIVIDDGSSDDSAKVVLSFRDERINMIPGLTPLP